MKRRTRMLIYDELKWITIHPNGKGAKLSNGEENVKGRPVLIDTETGRIVGGAIPKSLHGVKLKSKEEREKNGSKSFKEIIKSGQKQAPVPGNSDNPDANNSEAGTGNKSAVSGASVDPNSDPVSYARDPNADYSKINTLKGRHAFLQERVKNAKPISYDSSEADCKEYLKAVMPLTQCHIFSDYGVKGAAQMVTGASKIIEAFPLLGERLNSLQDQSSYLKNLKEFDKERNKEYKQAKKEYDQRVKLGFEKDPEAQANLAKLTKYHKSLWFTDDGKFCDSIYFTKGKIAGLSKGTKDKLKEFYKKKWP